MTYTRTLTLTIPDLDNVGNLFIKSLGDSSNVLLEIEGQKIAVKIEDLRQCLEEIDSFNN